MSTAQSVSAGSNVWKRLKKSPSPPGPPLPENLTVRAAPGGNYFFNCFPKQVIEYIREYVTEYTSTYVSIAAISNVPKTNYICIGIEILKSTATKMFVSFCKSTIFSAAATNFHERSFSGIKTCFKNNFQNLPPWIRKLCFLTTFSPEGKSIKKRPANQRRSLFEHCFKSCLDTGEESTWNFVASALKIVDLQNETNILVAKQFFFRLSMPMHI